MSLIDKAIGNKSRSAVALLRLGPAYCFSPVTKVDKTEFWYLDGLSANDSKQVGPCLLSWQSVTVSSFAADRLRIQRTSSATGFANTEDDQNESSCHEHPARMAPARRPKVADSAKQVKAANK